MRYVTFARRSSTIALLGLSAGLLCSPAFVEAQDPRQRARDALDQDQRRRLGVKTIRTFQGGELTNEVHYDREGRKVRANTPDGEVIYTFDRQGNLTSMDHATERDVFKYDKHGRRIKSLQILRGEEIGATQMSYELDGLDRVIRYIRKSADGHRVFKTDYQYNARGLVASTKTIGYWKGDIKSSSDYSWEYDDRGRETRQISVRRGGSVGFEMDRIWTLDCKSKYGDKGYLDEVECWEDGEVVRTEFHSYDENGNITKVATRTGAYRVSIQTWEYDYYEGRAVTGGGKND